MLKVNDVPTSVECKVNGRTVEMALDLATGLEFLVAYELQGKVAGPRQVGYDVCDSVLYPGLMFQVKHTAKPRGAKNGYPAAYTWVGNAGHQADYYILFAVKGEQLLPFLIPFVVWKTARAQDRGGPIGRLRVRKFKVTATMFGKRGHGRIHQNRFWNHYISDWPEGLHRRLNDYQQLSFELAT